ncbi:MerR family transcriptional regulator [Nocardioides sp. T2.26MG-1]|uniref:MerR family transcriptional regulator n=1 Tax=Nocardioides sp. T2.26MG-1 TaxID=3041166 RepID=UPI002477A57C|nr:MerR family transcriptional regulator [Nocardioides sp. T2.26MG-1]CAI9406433.1 hypothetical protein HIDPHFAB_04582 [Nocardioides sp. T2.26MG-1]
MTSPPLLTIGAFARAVGLTPSALRHYDECGLLVPAEIDDATGYRYYTPQLAERARLIVGMREAGVPIESMRRVLDASPDEAARLLSGLVEERAADAARAQAALREVLTAVASSPPVETAHVRLAGPVLAAAIRQVRVAADGDATSALGAVLLDASPAGLDVVATNRYWMAVRTMESAEPSGEGRVVLGLGEAAGVAQRLDHAGEVVLDLAGDRLRVAGADDLTAGRDTPYPAHRLLVAGLPPARATVVVHRDDLLEAITRVGRAEVTLVLSADGLGVGGDGPPTVAVGGAVRGDEQTVRMGSALLKRALGACLGAHAQLAVAGEHEAVRLSSPYQPGFVALVMPSPR